LARELRVPFLCACGFTCGVEAAFQAHLRRNEGAPAGAHAAVAQDGSGGGGGRGGAAAATLPPATTLPRLPPQPSPRRRASGAGAAAAQQPLPRPPSGDDASAAHRGCLASPPGSAAAAARRRKRSAGADETPRDAAGKAPRRAAGVVSSAGADADAAAALSPDAAPTTLKRMPFMQDGDADERDADAAPPAKRQAARRSAGGGASTAGASPMPSASPRRGRAAGAPCAAAAAACVRAVRTRRRWVPPAASLARRQETRAFSRQKRGEGPSPFLVVGARAAPIPSRRRRPPPRAAARRPATRTHLPAGRALRENALRRRCAAAPLLPPRAQNESASQRRKNQRRRHESAAMDALCGAAQGRALLESLFGASGSWSGGGGGGGGRGAKAARIGVGVGALSGGGGGSAFTPLRPARRVRLWELPWPALRRILLALPPAGRVGVGAVCKALRAASKHPEGATTRRDDTRAPKDASRCCVCALSLCALRARARGATALGGCARTQRGARRGAAPARAACALAHPLSRSFSLRVTTTLLLTPPLRPFPPPLPRRAAWTDIDLGAAPSCTLSDEALVAFVARSRLPLSGEYAMCAHNTRRVAMRCKNLCSRVLPLTHARTPVCSVSLDVSGCQAISYVCLVRACVRGSSFCAAMRCASLACHAAPRRCA
jgi:hypothetical protein